MIIIFILLVSFLGWQIVNLVVKQISLEEHLGLSFLLGIGIHSIVYFIFALMYKIIALDANIALLTAEVAIISTILKFLKRKTQHIKIKKKKLNYLEIFLICISLAAIGYTAIQNIYWPPYLSDSIHLYDFRAKRLVAGDVNGFFHGAKYTHTENYPPFTSLIHFFFYDAGLDNPKSVYTLLFLAFYFVIYGYVKRLTSNRTSGLATATLIIITPSIWWNSILAITNIPLMEYLSLAILYAYDAKNKVKAHKTWLISILLLGLSTWIRQEPLWFPVISLNIFYLIKDRKIKYSIVTILIFILMSWVWPLATNWITPANRVANEVTYLNQAIGSSFSSQEFLFPVKHISEPRTSPGDIAVEGMSKSWGLVFVIFILVVFSQIMIGEKLSRLQITTLLLPFTIWVGFIGFSRQFSGWHSLSDAIYRMVTFMIPLFWVSIITSPVWKLLKRKT